MVFASLEFLFLFLPAVLLLHFALPGRARNYLLLLFSLLFYAWGEPVYVLIMILSIIINFVCGRMIDRAADRQTLRRTVLAVGIAADLAILGVFKYAGFAVDNFNLLFGTDFAAPGIELPVGISFFTFQAMSYVVDVYRGDAPAQNNILDFGLYISFFPQLIAGPIVRYSTVAAEINSRSVIILRSWNLRLIWLLRLRIRHIWNRILWLIHKLLIWVISIWRHIGHIHS